MLRERLLALMDRKNHWAYPALTRPGLTRDQLLIHFRHEYLVYVRDFPVLLARTLGMVPPIHEVRRALSENLYEEATGGLSRTAPHPELFLRMMGGIGLNETAFVDDDGWLHPAARRYRDFLLERSATVPWQAGAALLTIFVEGSINERAELEGTFVRRSDEAAVSQHPLVKYYDCAPGAMELTRAHARVEGGHREDAWRIILSHVLRDDESRAVVETCEQALSMWHKYRDGVAERMGLGGNPHATSG